MIGSEDFNANRLFALKSQKAAARLMQFQNADSSYRREHATPSEIKELVDPYRALDKAGQELVRAVLAMETARCMGQNVSFSVAVKQE